MEDLGPGLTLVSLEVNTSSDDLLVHKSSRLLKGDCLVVRRATAETTVSRLEKIRERD